MGMMHLRSASYYVFEVVSKTFQEIGGATLCRVHSNDAKEYIALQDSFGGGDKDK